MAKRPPTAPQPTRLQFHFLRASEADEEARLNVQRQQLEAMAAAQAERENALRLAEEATRKRRRLRAAAFIGLSLVAAIAGWQWWKAERARHEAADQRKLALDARIWPNAKRGARWRQVHANLRTRRQRATRRETQWRRSRSRSNCDRPP